MMKYRESILLSVIIALLLLCFDGVAFGQNDRWQRAVQAGKNAMAQKRYADAERSFREAVNLAEKLKEKDAGIATGLILLAEACQFQARREEATALASRSLAALEKAGKGSSTQDPAGAFFKTEASAMILEKAADIFTANHGYDEAEQACKKLIHLREEAAGVNPSPKSNEDHLKFLSRALTNGEDKIADAYDELARVYLAQQRFADAEPLYAKSLNVREKVYGVDKPPVAGSLSNLATLYAAEGKFDKAEPLYAQAVKIFQENNWMDKPEAAVTFENYAVLLKKTGHEAEADAMMKQGKAIKAKPGQDNH
jgi:tetratricopeptide (TPR) repeat protein